MSMSRSRENCRVVLRVAKRMPLGLMLDRRTWVSCFPEPPIGEVSGGAEGTGWDQKMEEAVVVWVITEGCLCVDPVDQGVGWSVAFCDLLGKEE